MKTFARLFVITILLLPLTGVTFAQSQDQGAGTQTKKEARTVTLSVTSDGLESGGVISRSGVPGQNTFVFMSSEMSFDGSPVKGAPYSAQTVRSFTQTLSDGNRITRQSSGAVYRDSEGRTRREQTFNEMGPWSAQNDAPQTIFINDPVAGVNYILNPSDHTATKMTFNVSTETAVARKKFDEAKVKALAGAVQALPLPPPPPGDGQVMITTGPNFKYVTSDPSNTKTESLGAQSFDGVDADGTRTTITIPAGKIGNELPISIVDERWYSKDLQVVVMTRHRDPQYVETVYKLTGINRGEQPASLFTVPSDYTVKEGPARMKFRMAKPVPVDPKPGDEK